MFHPRIGVRSKNKRRSRMGWACGTVAPWCAALVVLVSCAAEAEPDMRVDMSRVSALSAPIAPDDLVPARVLAPRLLSRDPVVREAKLMVGDKDEFQIGLDEIDPRVVLKAHAKAFPSVDRSHKGDPSVGLRPTFDARLRKAGSLDAARGDALVFGDENPAAQPAGFVPGEGDVPGPETVSRFEPMPEGTTLTTAPSSSAASPQQGSGATTPHAEDGSTPTVARAASLESSTPAANDGVPIEVGALPKFSRGPHGRLLKGNTTVVGIEPAHPDYTALIDSTKVASEQKCLAEAIYFEARSEPEEGQAAVAQVVLNRVSSGLYPTSVCGVVFQNQQRHNACQFSFACEGKALRINESEAWEQAVRVAEEVTEGTAYVQDIGGSTHYHTKQVRPTWASRLKKMEVIGHHIFYKLKPGQT